MNPSLFSYACKCITRRREVALPESMKVPCICSRIWPRPHPVAPILFYIAQVNNKLMCLGSWILIVKLIQGLMKIHINSLFNTDWVWINYCKKNWDPKPHSRDGHNRHLRTEEPSTQLWSQKKKPGDNFEDDKISPNRIQLGQSETHYGQPKS